MTGQGLAATSHALNLWSQQLVGTVPVDINVTLTSMGAGILGGSYRQPSYLINGTFYPSPLANQLLGYDFSTQRDIRIEMNSNFSWYYGTNAPTPSNQVDWITIMLHEITHGLGFFSLCGNNGAYSYATSTGGISPTSYPGIFDRQLYLGTTGSICLTDINQSQRATLVTSNNLYSGRPSSYLLAANGGTRVKMYAPNSWQGGSSVSHWDDMVTFSTFMKWSASYGFRLHTFNAQKIGILRDMGWEIPCPTVVNLIGIVTTPITITTNTTMVSCGDINVQYVKVQNGAKLTLDAAGEVNIIGDFEVESGSEFEIIYP